MVKMTDTELLGEVLSLEELSDDEHRAFEDMQEGILKGKRSFLTPKQRAWVESRLERDDFVPEPKNLFSSLSPERQQAERKRAAAVVLPWEREDYVSPKPPRR